MTSNTPKKQKVEQPTSIHQKYKEAYLDKIDELLINMWNDIMRDGLREKNEYYSIQYTYIESSLEEMADLLKAEDLKEEEDTLTPFNNPTKNHKLQ